jgi:small subunit ribosomal protein S5
MAEKPRYNKDRRNDSQDNDLIEKVIKIDRVNKVVKGGKRLAFRAFVISGDKEGQVGFGLGKSKEVPVAIKKGITKAKKSFAKINMVNGTLPHEVVGVFSSSKVILKPAKPGTGVIAGGPVRILLEAAGFKNVVAKSMGSRNAINTTKAAINGLLQCRNLKNEELKRGKKLPVYVKTEE